MTPKHKNSENTAAVNAALNAREQSRTFRSKVGVSFLMYDGRIFGGFNIEKYGYLLFNRSLTALFNCFL